MSIDREPTPVGRVLGLYRYPVKSMGAEDLNRCSVSWQGIEGDRRWSFVRDGKTESNFPWLTLRQRSDMNRYTPSFVDPSQPEASSTLVRTPSGAKLNVVDPRLAAEICPEGAHVIRHSRGVFDTFPLSLITKQTIAQLGEIVGSELEVRRFRPNILVESLDDSPFPEDAWVGCVLTIGGVRMRIDKRDGRCAVITIDPTTGERRPEILKAVVKERQGCLGVYGTTVEPGEIAVGDLIEIESP